MASSFCAPCEGLDDVPHIFRRVAKLTTRNAGTKTEVTDTDSVVLECICKVIFTLGHCTNEDANTLLGSKVCYIVFHSNHGRIKTKGDFPTIGGQMISNGVLDDFE